MSVNPPHPVFVLIPGVSHTPAFYEPFVAELAKHGVTAETIKIPTVGYDTESKTLNDEIEAIRATVLRINDEENRDVALVCHSRGGIPGSRAIGGLDKETRVKNGFKTGIVEVVFVTAFLIPDNSGLGQAASSMPPWLPLNADGSFSPNESAKALVLSDLEPEAQNHWFDKFEPQRNNTDPDAVPEPLWQLSVPKTYILCSQDKAGPPSFQLSMLQAVINETWSVKTVKSGHEPFLSHPDRLAQVLLAPAY